MNRVCWYVCGSRKGRKGRGKKQNCTLAKKEETKQQPNDQLITPFNARACWLSFELWYV